MRSLQPELVQLLADSEEADVDLLRVYLACDTDGRRAIAKTVFQEGVRIMRDSLDPAT